MHSCVVLVPVGGSIVRQCEESLRELEKRGYEVRRVYGYSAIDQGRCQLATDAIMEGFEETLWIDSDIGFHPDDVEKIRNHNLPISCALYPQKGRRTLAAHLAPNTDKLVFGKQGGFAEVRYTGAGFLHVRREVYLKIQKELKMPVANLRFGRPLVPFFLPLMIKETWNLAEVASPLRPDDQPAKPTDNFCWDFQPDPVNTYWYLAEDFAFCERARRCGYKILADTSIRLYHYGTYGYSWEDAGRDVARFENFHFFLNKPDEKESPSEAAGDSPQKQ